VRSPIGVILAILAVASAAGAEELDKVKLGEARSLVAEAAKVEQLRQEGRVTGTYADSLSDDLRKDLKSLQKEPGLSRFVTGALTALECHDAASLGALRDRLAAMEVALGRAL
jgi:hypothetical protein